MGISDEQWKPFEAALDEFKEKMFSLAFGERHIGSQDSPASTIYHYTDAASALSILKNGRFWFTERVHLNDTLELQYGLRIAHKMFEDAITKAGPAVPPYAANDFLRELELALGEYGYWVASFSYADNDLSQWRSYVDNGKGVCLGFSPQAFDLSILFDNLAGAVSVHHARVEYDEPTLRELIREYIDETIKLLTRVNSGLPPRLRNQRRAVVYMRSVLRTLMMALYVPAMVSKHPAYQHEQESRLIVNGSRSIIEAMSCHKVRARNGEIISYVDMPIPNWKASNVLTHVRIGPAAQPKLAEQMASAFRSLGLPLPQIEPSGLPFRTTR